MEIELKGNRYSLAKLSVFDQLKVSRKLLPVLAGMVSDFQSLREVSQGGDISRAMETVLPKIAGAVADLSDEDTNAVIHPCLSVVSRRHGKDKWVPVFANGELAFDDIDLMTMLQLVGRVVGDSLGNFLPAAGEAETLTQGTGQS